MLIFQFKNRSQKTILDRKNGQILHFCQNRNMTEKSAKKSAKILNFISKNPF